MKTFLDTIHLAKEKQLNHLPGRDGAAFSGDKSLLHNPWDGLPPGNDSEVERNHYFFDKLR